MECEVTRTASDTAAAVADGLHVAAAHDLSRAFALFRAADAAGCAIRGRAVRAVAAETRRWRRESEHILGFIKPKSRLLKSRP